MAGRIRKAIETSAQAIKGIVDKVWNAVKGKPRSERGTKAEVEKKAIKQIAEKTGRSEKQIRDIQKGKRPGKNLLEPLKQIKRGRKVKAPPKDQKKITRRPAKAKKEKPPAKPPEAAPAPAAPPSVEVDFLGWVNIWGGDDESDPVRVRSVHVTMTGDDAAKFAALWNAGAKFDALKYATSYKFSSQGVGPGYLESVIGEPIVTFGE